MVCTRVNFNALFTDGFSSTTLTAANLLQLYQMLMNALLLMILTNLRPLNRVDYLRNERAMLFYLMTRRVSMLRTEYDLDSATTTAGRIAHNKQSIIIDSDDEPHCNTSKTLATNPAPQQRHSIADYFGKPVQPIASSSKLTKNATNHVAKKIKRTETNSNDIIDLTNSDNDIVIPNKKRVTLISNDDLGDHHGDDTPLKKTKLSKNNNDSANHNAGFINISTVETAFGASSSKVTLEMSNQSVFERDASTNNSLGEETGPKQPVERRKKKIPQTQGTRDRANQKRVAARQDPAHQKKVAEQLAAKLVESSGMDATVLANMFKQRVAHQTAILSATSMPSPTSPIAIVKSIVAAARREEQLDGIPANSPVWRHLKPVAHFMVDCTRNPFSFDVASYVSSGVLTQQKRALSQRRAEYYVRIVPFSSTADLRSAIVDYIMAFPADLPMAVVWLCRLGMSPCDAKAVVASSLQRVGWGDAANILMDLLDDNVLHSLNLGIPEDTIVHMPYVGYSIAGDPESRLDSDTNGGLHRRFINFCATTNTKAATYRFKMLDLAVEGPLAVRTDRRVGDVEACLIHCFALNTLNSARGGFMPHFTPRPDHRLIVDAALRAAGPATFLQSVSAALSKKVSALVDDEVDSWQGTSSSVETIHDNAIADIKKTSASVARQTNGEVVMVTLMKDITKEAHTGSVGGVYDATAGRGLRLHRHIVSLIYPEVPEHGDLGVEQIAQWFGPRLSFWRVILEHIWWMWSALFLFRYLFVLRPLLIVTHSSQMARLIRENTLPKVSKAFLDEQDEHARIDFLDGRSRGAQDLENAFTYDTSVSDKKSLKEYSTSEYIACIAVLSIIRYGSRHGDIAINVPSRHPGSIKYDPTFEVLRTTLQFLTQAVIEVTRIIIAKAQMEDPFQRVKGQDWNWMEARMAEAEQIISESGLRQAVDKVKICLHALESTIVRLRSAASNLKKRENGDAALRPTSKTNTAGKKPYQRSAATFLTAPSGKEREEQFAKLHQDELELQRGGNSTRFIPFGMSLHDRSFKTWFFELADGTDVVRAVNALGKSVEAQKKVQANFANVDHAREVKDQKQHLNSRTQELASRPKLLASAAQNLSNPIWMRTFSNKTPEKWHEYDGNLLAESWRYAVCLICGDIVIGETKNSKHYCNNGTKYVVKTDNFPGLKRLLYAHDSFLSPTLVEIGGADLLAVGLKQVNVRKFLTSHYSAHLPNSLSSLDPSLSTYVACSASFNFTLACCLDLSIPHFSTCPNPLTSHYLAIPWRQHTLEMVVNVLSGQDPSPICNTNCTFGTVFVTKVLRDTDKTCNHSCPLKTSNKRYCGTTEQTRVNTFFDLPVHYCRRIIYHTRLQSSRRGEVGWKDGGMDVKWEV
ncbi:hypothetical protein BD410DRAFT_826787 [Rickenella mellea]|uniref:Uncharacterized protein n=1 Tax=Rickenella mellea TaxID=50990 RepID=A0A4Y7QC69_9AGAM|nr:hypothetical protein BD410DRAFT_826787 [Rickenella mellea]